MGKSNKQTALFSLEGRFLSYELEDGYKIKRLRLAAADGEHEIKLSKEARVSIGRVLVPGEWIQVWGEKTTKLETAEVKLRAYRVAAAAPAQRLPNPAPIAATQSAQRQPAKPTQILVCQKSDCMKRGGRAVCQALASTLADRGLDEQVTIRGTGCMKQCKAGPNLVMPDKTRYSRITAADVPAVVDKHFPIPAPKQAEECLPIGTNL